MDRILLQIKRKNERRQFEDWLTGSYAIELPDGEKPFAAAFDLAILDGASLKQYRRELRQRRHSEEPVLLPFLLTTTRRKGSLPSRHLGHVVDDVILRPVTEKELLARVANLLRMRRWSLDLKREHDRVMKLAVTDDVSGFHNTRYLHRYLDRAFDANSRMQELCLVFFDLDNFKRFVDEQGHLAGSKALKEVAAVVHKVLDAEDRIVRYGGDEFIVLLPRQNKQEALAKVHRMQNAISQHLFLHKEGIDARLEASFGLACYPTDASNKHELLAQADRCLFESKAAGKNRVTTSELEFAA